MNHKTSGFSKDWEWKEPEPQNPEIKNNSASARKIAIKYFRDNGEKVSSSAGSIGLARRILGESGKTWPGHMKKGMAKRIIRDFAFGKQKAKKKVVFDFYRSPEWRKLRYEALVRCGRVCMCCGAKPSDGIILHVDHVKPRSKFPELELEITNLQVLCEDCNLGKSNIYAHDFR